MSKNPADYRPCVGIVLLNQQNLVFTGKRIDSKTTTHKDCWQMPQGGIDDGESPEQAMFREMLEEIGTNKAEIIKQLPDWVYYDLPENLQGKLWSGQYKGQRQRWFVCRFTGQDSDINIATEHPEFCEWQWQKLEALPDMIVPFKRKLYEQVVAGVQSFEL